MKIIGKHCWRDGYFLGWFVVRGLEEWGPFNTKAHADEWVRENNAV